MEIKRFGCEIYFKKLKAIGEPELSEKKIGEKPDQHLKCGINFIKSYFSIKIAHILGSFDDSINLKKKTDDTRRHSVSKLNTTYFLFQQFKD